MSGNIPMADLAAQHAPLADELVAAFRRVVASGRFVLGPEVEAFERAVAQRHGVRHAIGVSSGTDALLAALMALGVGPGDEVITTPTSFFATAAVVARLGATPIFADIDEDYLMDARAAERAVTPRTRAIILVHLFGRVAAAPRVSVPIVEDAAQAFGARGVGRIGAAACLSFFPTKNLGALGDAGLVLTDDDDRAARLRKVRVQGQRRKHQHEILGGNFRLDELQAALLRVKLPHLDAWNARRRENADAYAARLTGTPLRLPRFADGDVVHQYVVRTPYRDALRAYLAERGVETDVYYPLPMYRQPALGGDGAAAAASCPNAEAAARDTLALPVHSEIGEAEVARVADAIVAFYQGGTFPSPLDGASPSSLPRRTQP